MSKKSKLKIVFLLSRIQATGVTTHSIDLIEGLTNLGHSVLVITGGVTKEKYKEVYDFYPKIRNFGAEIKEFKAPSGPIFTKTKQIVSSTLLIMKWIKQYNPNIIHSQSPYMTFIPWLLRKKSTTTIHQVGLSKNIKFKRPTHVIAISNESKLDCIKNLGIREQDVTIIHHGVSSRFSDPIAKESKIRIKKEWNLPNDKILIGVVGTLSHRKGTDIIVNALGKLHEEIKRKIHIVFLGGSVEGHGFKWLNEMAVEANMEKKITQIPFRDPKPFYDIFDVLVLASRQESFPLVTLEAMMAECCPIRSNCEGAYEQIENGKTGLLFENENYDDLAKMITKVVVDDDLRKNMAKNSKEKALREFTIPQMTKETINIYGKIDNL